MILRKRLLKKSCKWMFSISDAPIKRYSESSSKICITVSHLWSKNTHQGVLVKFQAHTLQVYWKLNPFTRIYQGFWSRLPNNYICRTHSRAGMRSAIAITLDKALGFYLERNSFTSIFQEIWTPAQINYILEYLQIYELIHRCFSRILTTV